MAKSKKRKLHLQSNAPKDKTRKTNPSKASTPAKHSGPTIPFAAEDRILLVGEGDFSFARSIVDHHGCCDVTATCLEQQPDLFQKYDPQAEQHVRYLEDEGQSVIYEVDATKIDQHKKLRDAGRFDRILFNFPHVGGKSKDVNRQVRFNQELLVKFFGAARPLLAHQGTIVVTLFEREPYTLWNVKDLARHSGLIVQRSFNFSAEAYPGYHHARTLGNIEGGGGWKGEDRSARSFIFEQKAEGKEAVLNSGKQMEKKRKRGDASDSEDD